MQLHVVAVGRLRPALRTTCDDYLRRLRRFVPITEREVREAGRAGSVAKQRDTEARHLLDAMPAGADVVLLDQGGAMWSSEDLATQLEGWRLAARDVALVVGGAVGVGGDVVSRAGTRWSLGPLTLPHELARVIVIEQLYRASTILKGEPYHRASRST